MRQKRRRPFRIVTENPAPHFCRSFISSGLGLSRLPSGAETLFPSSPSHSSVLAGFSSPRICTRAPPPKYPILVRPSKLGDSYRIYSSGESEYSAGTFCMSRPSAQFRGNMRSLWAGRNASREWCAKPSRRPSS